MRRILSSALLAGFLFLVAGARLGGAMINGLREINVTRVNAMTEYRYQKHKWMSMDPTFHQIAEQEALLVLILFLLREKLVQYYMQSKFI
jgi:hypothetical protein